MKKDDEEKKWNSEWRLDDSYGRQIPTWKL
jgi:hypothetical protein